MTAPRHACAVLGRTARRRGFSVIELAVVVGILGITLTLTLKGTVLIEIMKALVTGYQLQVYQNRVQLYGVEFGYLPGDDPKAANRFRHPQATRSASEGEEVVSLGDSKIDGHFLDFGAPLGEHFMAWRDLRYARLLDGDPDVLGAAALPKNLFDGVYGFDEGNLGQERGSLCLNRVPGGAAQRIDKSLDDGVIDQGQVVATAQPDSGTANGHYSAPDSQPYDVEKEYIICLSLAP